jgi:uncharacterized protein
MIHILKQSARMASTELTDWGDVKEPIGDLIAKLRGREAAQAGEPDYGIWECSPGRWQRQVKEAEFAHFIAGRCTFVADDGQRLEIAAGDTTYWPANSMGVWDVHETIRKVYIILK